MAAVFRALVLGLCTFAVGSPARAADPRKTELGADLGYAFPAGGLERGSALSDVTFGAARLGLDGAYRLHSLFSVGAAISYGIVIPTLCNTGGDCTSSFGSDLALGVLGRWHVGTWGFFEPALDLKLGYEWFSAKHSDSDVVSSRSFRGFQAAVRGDGQFRLSRVFSLGPFVDLSVGIFSKARLEAPGIDRARDVAGSAAHLWIALGARALASW